MIQILISIEEYYTVGLSSDEKRGSRLACRRRLHVSKTPL